MRSSFGIDVHGFHLTGGKGMNGKNGSRRGHLRKATVRLLLPLLVALLIMPMMTASVLAAPGDIVLCSSDSSGAQGNAASMFLVTISADGRYVAFASNATNLVTPNTTGIQVFRKDLVTNQTVLVSANAAGAQGDAASTSPAISNDGRFVAFHSTSTNLVSPATTLLQVFRKDLATGEVRLVSSDAAGAQANGTAAYIPDIS